MTSQDNGNDSDQVIYLLGFSPLLTGEQISKIEEELPFVESRAFQDITAWFVHVERSLFEGPQAESNLTDLAWLTPKAIAHQHALDILSSLTAFYPARFGTLFSSFAVLKDIILTNENPLTQFFEQMAEKQEWGIKISVSWSKAVKAFELLHSDSTANPEGSGFNYLRQQKKIRDRDRSVRDWLDQALHAIDNRLLELSEQTCHRRIQANTNDKDREVLANIALLCQRSDAKELIEWADSYANHTGKGSESITIELTGPWPLFSFCPELLSITSIEQNTSSLTP